MRALLYCIRRMREMRLPHCSLVANLEPPPRGDAAFLRFLLSAAIASRSALSVHALEARARLAIAQGDLNCVQDCLGKALQPIEGFEDRQP